MQPRQLTIIVRIITERRPVFSCFNRLSLINRVVTLKIKVTHYFTSSFYAFTVHIIQNNFTILQEDKYLFQSCVTRFSINKFKLEKLCLYCNTLFTKNAQIIILLCYSFTIELFLMFSFVRHVVFHLASGKTYKS